MSRSSSTFSLLLIQELGWNRSDVVVSTKLMFGTKGFSGQSGPNETGLSRKHIIEGIKASLQRLQMDYVDLIFAHRPDPNTPIEETVRAFNWVIDQGWAFYWGTSEWSTEQLQEAWDVAERLNLIGPAFEQPEYNMFNRQKVEVDYQPLYEKYGLGTTIWSPLAGGVLTGKYAKGFDEVPEGSRLTVDAWKGFFTKEYFPDEKFTVAPALAPIAQELGASVAQLALAWTLKNPHVSTAMIGSTKVEQLKDNLAAAALVDKLTDDVMARIDEIIKRWAPKSAVEAAKQNGSK
eukprot:jgi/Chrzof1/12870/Cz07g10110.t1